MTRIREALGNERIDIVGWPDTDMRRIKYAFAPHTLLRVEVDSPGRRAVVAVAPEDYELVMGADGRFRDMASRFTGFSIDVVVA